MNVFREVPGIVMTNKFLCIIDYIIKTISRVLLYVTTI